MSRNSCDNEKKGKETTEDQLENTIAVEWRGKKLLKTDQTYLVVHSMCWHTYRNNTFNMIQNFRFLIPKHLSKSRSLYIHCKNDLRNTY